MERIKDNSCVGIIDPEHESDEDDEASIRDVMSDENLAGVRGFFFPLREYAKKAARQRTKNKRTVKRDINLTNESKKIGKYLSQMEKTKHSCGSEIVRKGPKIHEIVKDVQDGEKKEENMNEKGQRRKFLVDSVVAEHKEIENMESCSGEASYDLKVDSCGVELDGGNKCRKVKELQDLMAQRETSLGKLDKNFGCENSEAGNFKEQETDLRLNTERNRQSNKSEDLKDFLLQERVEFPKRYSMSSKAKKKHTVTKQDEEGNWKLDRSMSDYNERTRLEVEEHQDSVMLVAGSASCDKSLWKTKVDQRDELTEASSPSDIDYLANEYEKKIEKFKIKTQTLRKRCKSSEKERRYVEEKLRLVQTEHQNLRSSLEQAVCENEKLKKDLEEHLKGCNLVKEGSINTERRGILITEMSNRRFTPKMKQARVSFNLAAEQLRNSCDRNASSETSKPYNELPCLFCVSRREDIIRLEAESKMLYERLPRLEAIHSSLIKVAKVAVERESKLQEDYDQLTKSVVVLSSHTRNITNQGTNGNSFGVLSIKQGDMGDMEEKLRLMQADHQKLRDSFEEAIKENREFKRDLEEHLKGCNLVKEESRNIEARGIPVTKMSIRSVPPKMKGDISFDFETEQSNSSCERSALIDTSKPDNKPSCLLCISRREDIIRLESENNMLYERLPQLEAIYSSLLKVAKIAVERESKLKDDYDELKASLAGLGSNTRDTVGQGTMNKRSENNEMKNDASYILCQRSSNYFLSKTSERFPHIPSQRKIGRNTCSISMEGVDLFSKYTDVLNEVQDFENFVQSTVRNEIEKIKSFVEEVKEYRQSSRMENMKQESSFPQRSELQQEMEDRNGFNGCIDMNSNLKLKLNNMSTRLKEAHQNEERARNVIRKLRAQLKLEMSKNQGNPALISSRNEDNMLSKLDFEETCVGRFASNDLRVIPDNAQCQSDSYEGEISSQSKSNQKFSQKGHLTEKGAKTSSKSSVLYNSQREEHQRPVSIMKKNSEFTRVDGNVQDKIPQKRLVSYYPGFHSSNSLHASSSSSNPNLTPVTSLDNRENLSNLEKTVVKSNENSEEDSWNDCQMDTGITLLRRRRGTQFHEAREDESWREGQFDTSITLLRDGTGAQSNQRSEEKSRNGCQLDASVTLLGRGRGVQSIKSNEEESRNDDHLDSGIISLHQEKGTLSNESSGDESRNVGQLDTGITLVRVAHSSENYEEESRNDDRLGTGSTSLRQRIVVQPTASSDDESSTVGQFDTDMPAVRHVRVAHSSGNYEKESRNDDNLDTGSTSLRQRIVVQSTASSDNESSTVSQLDTNMPVVRHVRVAHSSGNYEKESRNDDRLDTGSTSLRQRIVVQSSASSDDESSTVSQLDTNMPVVRHVRVAHSSGNNEKESRNDDAQDTGITLVRHGRVAQSNNSYKEKSRSGVQLDTDESDSEKQRSNPELDSPHYQKVQWIRKSIYDRKDRDSEEGNKSSYENSYESYPDGVMVLQNCPSSSGQNFHVLELMDKNDDEISVGEYPLVEKKRLSLKNLKSNLSLRRSSRKLQREESGDLQDTMRDRSQSTDYGMDRFRIGQSDSQTNLVKIGSSGMLRKNQYKKVDSTKKKTAVLQLSKLLPKISKKVEKKKSKRVKNGMETLPKSPKRSGNRKKNDSERDKSTRKSLDNTLVDNADLIHNDIQEVANIARTPSSSYEINYEQKNNRIEVLKGSGNLDSLEEHYSIAGKFTNSSSNCDGNDCKSRNQDNKENESMTLTTLPYHAIDDQMKIEDKDGGNNQQNVEGLVEIAASKQEVESNTWSPRISSSFPLGSEIYNSGIESTRRRSSIKSWIMKKMKEFGRNSDKENDLGDSESVSARETDDKDKRGYRNTYKTNEKEKRSDEKERNAEMKCSKKIAKLEKKKRKLTEKSKIKESKEREKMREVERRLETMKEEQDFFKIEKDARGSKENESMKSKAAPNRFIKNIIKARLYRKSMKEKKRKLDKKMKKNKEYRGCKECAWERKECRFQKQEIKCAADSDDEVLNNQISNEIDMMTESNSWKKKDGEKQLEKENGLEKKPMEGHILKDSPKNEDMEENETRTRNKEEHLKSSNENIEKSSALHILLAWDDDVKDFIEEDDSKENVIFHIKENNDSQIDKEHEPIKALMGDSSYGAQLTHETPVEQVIQLDQCIEDDDDIENVHIRETANYHKAPMKQENLENKEHGLKSTFANAVDNFDIENATEIIEIDTGENDFEKEETQRNKRLQEKKAEITEGEGHCDVTVHSFQDEYSESDMEFECTKTSAITRKVVRTKPQIHRKPSSFQSTDNKNISGGRTKNIYADAQDVISMASNPVEAEIGYFISGQSQDSRYEVSTRSDKVSKDNAKVSINVNEQSAEIKDDKKINGMIEEFSGHIRKSCKLDVKDDVLTQNSGNTSDWDAEEDLDIVFSDAETARFEDDNDDREKEMTHAKTSQFAEEDKIGKNKGKKAIIAKKLNDSESLLRCSDKRQNESNTYEDWYEGIDEEKPELMKGHKSPSDKVVFTFPDSKKWVNREKSTNHVKMDSIQDASNRKELNDHLTASESSLEDIIRWINSEPTKPKVPKDVNQNVEPYNEREQKLIQEITELRRENELLKSSSNEQNDNDALMFFDLEGTESTSKVYSISGARNEEFAEINERTRVEIERAKRETQEAKSIAEEANMSIEIMKESLEESQREVERMKIEMKNRIEEQKIHYEKRIEEAEKYKKILEVKGDTARELEGLKAKLSATTVKVREHDRNEHDRKLKDYKNCNSINEDDGKAGRLLESSSVIGEDSQNLEAINSSVVKSLSAKGLGDNLTSAISGDSNEIVDFGLQHKLKASEETIVELRRENERLTIELERHESKVRLEKYKEELRNLMEMTLINENETSGGADSAEKVAVNKRLGQKPCTQIKELRVNTAQNENVTSKGPNDIVPERNGIVTIDNEVHSCEEKRLQSQSASLRARSCEVQEPKLGNSSKKQQLRIHNSESQPPEANECNVYQSQQSTYPVYEIRNCEDIGGELEDSSETTPAFSYNGSKFDLQGTSDWKLTKGEHDHFDDNSEMSYFPTATSDSHPSLRASSVSSRHESSRINGREKDKNDVTEHVTGTQQESETVRHQYVTKNKKSKKRLKQLTSFLLTPSEKNVRLEPYFGPFNPLPSIGRE